MNLARTVQTIAAEITNEAALTANTALAPITATSAPPIAGPSATPALRLMPSRLFAHDRCSSPATLGMAASDADQNGASATADANAHPSSHAGSSPSAISAKQAAPARSDAIRTFRRS